MKNLVLSRTKVEAFIERAETRLEDFNFISIVDSDAPQVKGFPEAVNVLRMRFDDLNEDDWNTPERRMEIERNEKIIFDEKMAQEIIRFVEEMDKSKDLIVHCHLGVCRSGAVGYFIRWKLGLDFDQFLRINPQIVPNTYVFGTLMRVQDMNVSKKVSDGLKEEN